MRDVLSFFDVKEGLKQFTVEVTQRCRSRCIFCSSGSSPETVSHEIPLPLLKKLSDFGASKGLKVINTSGGEPFLHPDLVAFIEHNIKNGLKTNVYTSGNMTREEFDRVMAANISPEHLKFTFNYQSCSEKVFKALTNAEPFSVNDVHSYMKEMMAKGYEVGVHMVPNRLNLDTLHSSVKHLRDMGVSNIGILRMVAQERALDNKDTLAVEKDPYIAPDPNRPHDRQEDILEVPPMPENLVSVLKGVKLLQTPECRIKVGVPFDRFVNNRHICEAGLQKMVVRYDGMVFPCEAFKGEAILREKPWLNLGNIYTDKLEDIYKNGMYAFCALRAETTGMGTSIMVWSGERKADYYPLESQNKMKESYLRETKNPRCPMNDVFKTDLWLKSKYKEWESNK